MITIIQGAREECERASGAGESQEPLGGALEV